MINLDYVNCLTLLCATPPSPVPGNIETLQTTEANGVTPLWPCIEQSQAGTMLQQQSERDLAPLDGSATHLHIFSGVARSHLTRCFKAQEFLDCRGHKVRPLAQ